MKRLICLLMLEILGQGVYGNNAGEKGAAFLKLGQGARANGMAGAYCAIADDSSACYWNPAGLVQLEQNETLFMYHRPMTEVDGLAYSNINMALPSVNEAFGVSLVYLGYKLKVCKVHKVHKVSDLLSTL